MSTTVARAVIFSLLLIAAFSAWGSETSTTTEPEGVRLRLINEEGQHTAKTVFFPWGTSQSKVEQDLGALGCETCGRTECIEECWTSESWTLDFGRNVTTIPPTFRFCGDGLGSLELCEYEANLSSTRQFAIVVHALENDLGEADYKTWKYDEVLEFDYYRWDGDVTRTLVEPKIVKDGLYLLLTVSNLAMKKSQRDKPTTPFSQ